MTLVTVGKWGDDLAVPLRGKSSDEWRAEYANAYDWGADVGREVIAE